MRESLLNKILILQLNSGQKLSISISGHSMNPTMLDGDQITVCKDASYSIGDVLVFKYKGELLVHRLVKFKNNRLFCKGDNSFRLEDIVIDDIVGKVTLLNGREIPTISNLKIELSYLVGQEFRKCAYNIDNVKNSGIYRFYHQVMWEVEDKTLKYKISQAKTTSTFISEYLRSCIDANTGTKYDFEFICHDIIRLLQRTCFFYELIECFDNAYLSSPMVTVEQINSFIAYGVVNGLIEVI